MRIVGIDLSGPGSAQKTAVTVFHTVEEGLRLASFAIGATDGEILTMLPTDGCIVGIDAPLSYSASGGSRRSDKALQKAAIQAGLHPGAVMAPTAPRMVYLTLRGVALSRLLAVETPNSTIVEVHPTATLALRGAPLNAVRTFKSSEDARRLLAAWLKEQGLDGIEDACRSDHGVAACAGALAAWKWAEGMPVWLDEAEPPLRPYDFAC